MVIVARRLGVGDRVVLALLCAPVQHLVGRLTAVLAVNTQLRTVRYAGPTDDINTIRLTALRVGDEKIGMSCQ
ncbi:hypothetical protein C8T65DRAFT_651809 [Cerioporus squamosus]|nr:hypothetical protein C8T65DRAFT_651809 [Cerioporus squamosus]